jgi:hypothetical protein
MRHVTDQGLGEFDSVRRWPIVMLLAAATCAPCGAGAQEPADAYVNDDARTLVRLARLRRNTVDRRIEAYGTTARERFSVGLHAGIGEKLVYRRETVTRIDWQRDGPVALDVLAMREVSPLFDAEPEVPLDMSAELLRLAFDPVESEMLLRFDTTGIRHPLTEGSEAQYRFEAGDTTVIRLPDGRAVRLRELRFIPRRRDPHLIHGSFWLERRRTPSYRPTSSSRSPSMRTARARIWSSSHANPIPPAPGRTMESSRPPTCPASSNPCAPTST